MLEVDAAGSNGRFASQLQSFGECGDDELSVLPRHTKVVVTGNNRTKSVLVGLRGVVKKAVGLGGWHWLVLTNGIEVKLQRNALSVIEAATGKEVDEDLEFDTGQWSSSGITASNDTQKSYRSRPRMHKSFEPSRKTLSTSLSSGSDSKDSLSTQKVYPVDLGKLEVGALWRYLQHFNLVDDIHNPPSREELTDIVQRHFMSQQLDDLQVIKGLVTSAKRLKTGYELKGPDFS